MDEHRRVGHVDLAVAERQRLRIGLDERHMADTREVTGGDLEHLGTQVDGDHLRVAPASQPADEVAGSGPEIQDGPLGLVAEHPFDGSHAVPNAPRQAVQHRHLAQVDAQVEAVELLGVEHLVRRRACPQEAHHEVVTMRDVPRSRSHGTMRGMRLDRTITAVDAHAGGEPGRVIVGGVHDVPGATMLEKRDHLAQHGDHLRRLMLREPRGYPATCCNVVLPPTDPKADAGYVIMEQAEYPAMSGSNTICTATVLIETGMVTVTEPITELVLEAPAGLIRVRACTTGQHGSERPVEA